MLSIVIPGKPVAYARSRHNGSFHYKPGKLSDRTSHKGWELHAVALMRDKAPAEPMANPVAVSILAVWPPDRPRDEETYGRQTREDIDNVAKLVLDAMVKACWLVDDNHVAVLDVTRVRASRTSDARVEVEAVRLET